FKTTAFLPTAFRLAFSCIGFELLLVAFPRVRGKQMRAGLIAAALSTVILTSFTAFAVAYFGEEYIIKQIFPLLTLVRSLQAPVIERLDIYFIMIWLPAMGSSVIAYLMIVQLAAVEIFPRLSYRLVLGIVAVLLIGMTLPLTDFNIVQRLVNYVGVIQFAGLGLILPSLIWLVAAVRGLRA
ncbi:MAG: GerAB/ArcD/ProY family transporter, partial [Bacteroidota bacterium]